MAARPGLSAESVLAAAAELADKAGWERLSLAELAARLKVKPPSLYNHLESLEALKRDLALMAIRKLAAALGKAVIAKSGDQAVRSLARAYRGFVREHPGLYYGTVRAPDNADAQLTQASDEIVEICLAVIRSCGLGRRTALHALRALRSAVHGFATLESGAGFGIPLNVDESFAWLVECCIRGLNVRRLNTRKSVANRRRKNARG